VENMTNQELKEWRTLQKQFANGYHLSKNDWKELVRLNHIIKEVVQNIHNENMQKLKF